MVLRLFYFSQISGIPHADLRAFRGGHASPVCLSQQDLGTTPNKCGRLLECWQPLLREFTGYTVCRHAILCLSTAWIRRAAAQQKSKALLSGCLASTHHLLPVVLFGF